MKTIQFEYEDFPFCCALTVVGDFGVYNKEHLHLEKLDALSNKEIKEFAKENAKRFNGNSFIMTIPDTDAYRRIKTAFRKLGFRRIGTPVKSNHGKYTVSLYQSPKATKP